MESNTEVTEAHRDDEFGRDQMDLKFGELTEIRFSTPCSPW